MGGLNGTGWPHFGMIAPYAMCGVLLCFLLPSKMNILMLGDETANSLGLRKIGDITVQPDNDQTRGKIAKIGYLLQVTEEN